MITYILFYTTYFGGIFMALFRYPVLAFVVYQLIYFYNPKGRWWGVSVPDISYSYSTVITMMLVFLFTFKVANQNALLKIPAFRWAAALYLCLLFSTQFAAFPDVHMFALENHIKMLITIAIAYKLIDTQQKLNWSLWAYVYGSWYITYLAQQLGRNRGGRVQGIGTVDSPDANGIAAAIAPAIVIGIYYLWQCDKKWQKGLFFIALVFIANGLILINSRGAILGVAVSLTYFFGVMYFSKVRKKSQKLIVMMFAVLGLSGGLYLADDSFIERMQTMVISSEEVDLTEESGATRFLFWKYAFEMSKDYPFGAGARGFVALSPIYLPADLGTGASRNRATHSTWLEALTEAGFIGFFCMLMLMYSTFKMLTTVERKFKQEGNIKSYYLVISIKAGLICFMVSMTFLNRLRAEILYWLILYAACLYNIYILKPKLKVEYSEQKNGRFKKTLLEKERQQ